jgi:hypothetical protein
MAKQLMEVPMGKGGFSRGSRLVAAGRCGGAVAAGIAVASALPVADLIKKAAGINGSAGGLGQLVNTVNGILTPLLVTSAAIGTLALVCGGAALMMGHPRAMRLLGGVVAGLILIGGAKGVIA